MQKETIDEAAKEINDAMRLMHRLHGKYPSSFIRKQVETWYSDGKSDTDYVINIISYIENKKYANTAVTHLAKISGVSKYTLDKDLFFNPAGGTTSSSQADMKEVYKDLRNILCGLGIIIAYWYLLIFQTDLDFLLKVLLFMFGPAPLLGVFGWLFRTDFFK